MRWLKDVRKVLLNLQILRAFAALSVVLFHTIGTAASYGFDTRWISYLEGWGASGVDVFFVISGFVMLYTQLDNKRSVKDFLVSRAIRIIPIYWLLTIIIAVVYLVAPFAFRELVVTPDWLLASLGFMSTAVIGKHPIVYLGWTLEWEMLFYLVFGISLLFRSWTATLAVTTVVLLAVALAVSNFILMEFVAGLLIALLFKKYGFKRFGRSSLIVGSLLLLISINSDVRALIESRVILWGIPSVLIVYGAVATMQLNSSIGKLLGDASYSIYLIQMLSIQIFYKALSIIGLNVNSDIMAIICLVATAIGGTIMHLTVEKPITRVLKNVFLSNSHQR